MVKRHDLCVPLLDLSTFRSFHLPRTRGFVVTCRIHTLVVKRSLPLCWRAIAHHQVRYKICWILFVLYMDAPLAMMTRSKGRLPRCDPNKTSAPEGRSKVAAPTKPNRPRRVRGIAKESGQCAPKTEARTCVQKPARKNSTERIIADDALDALLTSAGFDVQQCATRSPVCADVDAFVNTLFEDVTTNELKADEVLTMEPVQEKTAFVKVLAELPYTIMKTPRKVKNEAGVVRYAFATFLQPVGHTGPYNFKFKCPIRKREARVSKATQTRITDYHKATKPFGPSVAVRCKAEVDAAANN